MFTCKKLSYIWDTERCEFLKLRGLDTGVRTSELHQMHGLYRQEQFMRFVKIDLLLVVVFQNKFNNNNNNKLPFFPLLYRRSVYGNNEIQIPVKSILNLLCLEVLNPFYVFQILSFCLWIADDYYYYAMAIISMSVFSIFMAVFQTRQVIHNY